MNKDIVKPDNILINKFKIISGLSGVVSNSTGSTSLTLSISIILVI